MTLRIVFSVALLAAGMAYGQRIIAGPSDNLVLRPEDEAALEGHVHRTDLPCSPKPLDTELGFDRTLHSGYEVSVPIGELAGRANVLTAIFRVTPTSQTGNRTYFYQNWPVPEIADGTRGVAHLKGVFVLGEGKYLVDWLMRDRDERSCSAHWQINAIPNRKDKLVEFRIPPGSVAEPSELFVREGPVKRDSAAGLNAVVMLHAASLYPGQAEAPTDAIPPVLSILRNIAREPRIGSYSLVAFNLERRQVLFRREHAPEVDFQALGEAIQNLQLNTIDVKRLRPPDSEAQFLGELLAEEVGQNHPDVMIFVGPKGSPDVQMRGALKETAGPGCPVFYLTYIPNPASNPWRDLIGSAVKLWKGLEYTIARPRDLFVAWNEVMSRIGTPNRAGADTEEPLMHRSLAGKK